MRLTVVAATAVFALVLGARLVIGLIVLPPEVHVPGTFPLFDNDEGVLASPNLCAECHGDYDKTLEPSHNWRGSMMANATRDPLFWAAYAVAEQDFEGAGDWCLRCHSPTGWLGGRSTPTDGSALLAADAQGITCDTCHRMTNPDNSEHLGVHGPERAQQTHGTGRNEFQANDKGDPPIGYYGGGM